MGTLNPKDPDYIFLAPSKEVVQADRAKPYDVKVSKPRFRCCCCLCLCSYCYELIIIRKYVNQKK